MCFSLYFAHRVCSLHNSCFKIFSVNFLSLKVIESQYKILAFFWEFFQGDLLLCKFLLFCYCFRTKFQGGAKVFTASGGRPLPLWKKARVWKDQTRVILPVESPSDNPMSLCWSSDSESVHTLYRSPCLAFENILEITSLGDKTCAKSAQFDIIESLTISSTSTS